MRHLLLGWWAPLVNLGSVGVGKDEMMSSTLGTEEDMVKSRLGAGGSEDGGRGRRTLSSKLGLSDEL